MKREKNIFDRVYEDAILWCKGRSWIPRLLILVGLVYIGIQQWRDPLYRSIFAGLNLGIHELGHGVFRFFGEFLMVAGGTILQCLAPVVGIILFARQRDYFAISFALGWLSTNFFEVSIYAADARSMSLPLVIPGVGVGFADELGGHDWNYLLSSMGWLRYDATIASLFRFMSTICMILCLILGLWLVFQMYLSSEKKSLIKK